MESKRGMTRALRRDIRPLFPRPGGCALSAPLKSFAGLVLVTDAILSSACETL